MNRRHLFATGAILLSSALAASGCLGHVRLEAPAPDAPLKERKAAYERLRPVSVSTTTYYQDGMMTGAQSSLELADGRKVHHAEDLLAIVPPDSECARSVHDHLGLRRTAGYLNLAGYGAVAVGAGMIFAGLSQSISDRSGDGSGLFFTGAGVMITGAAVNLLVQLIWTRASMEKAKTAFKTYDDALMQRLRLRRAVYTVDEAEGAPGSGVRPVSDTGGS